MTVFATMLGDQELIEKTRWVEIKVENRFAKNRFSCAGRDSSVPCL